MPILRCYASFMVDKNTDVEIACSMGLEPLITGEECNDNGTVEISFTNDECGSSSRSYIYCIEEVENTTTLYIPYVHDRYLLKFMSSGLQGMASNLYTTN